MPIYLLSPRTILVVEVTIKLKNMMDDKKIEEVAKVYMIGEFYDRDEAEWNYPITTMGFVAIDLDANTYKD